MAKDGREILVGMAVFAALVLALGLSYGGSQLKPVGGYALMATFNRVDGLVVGDDIRLSGMKVGSVVDHGLDPETFDAVVALSIASEVKQPTDTVAGIASEGLLGDKYVRLEPGTQKTYLAAGATITKTKDFRSLGDQVGEIIFLATGGSDSGGGTK
ncbi:MAG: MlaD family protein [Rhodospirillales bacterium]|jgi:phospholipid/cholesterol/gamma-HCH transport system substrate-binding protein|nr:MlaD family protein [Rhodospirillales bacterium]MDP6883433.1 MlaD family protein [Rhodospirillales bacterium]